MFTMKKSYILVLFWASFPRIFCGKSSNFGKYFLVPTKLIKCNYTKKSDIQHSVDSRFEISNDEKRKGDLYGYMYIPSDLQYDKGEFLLDIWKNGKYQNVLTKSSNSICTDKFLSFPLRLIVKPDKNCIGRSGNYSVNINLNQYAHIVMGNTFFYQKIHSKLEYFTKDGSIFCLEILAEIKPI